MVVECVNWVRCVLSVCRWLFFRLMVLKMLFLCVVVRLSMLSWGVVVFVG